MLKKILVSLICLTLSIQFAFANQQAGLSEAYNEFKFAMTVEWDQQDEAFAAEQAEAFYAKVNELGVSYKELVTFILSQIKQEAAREHTKSIIGQINADKMSFVELKGLVAKSMKETSLRGASWNGEGEAVVGAIMAVFLITFFIIMMDRHYSSSRTCLFC